MDLESYVPTVDRVPKLSSMFANPSNPSHFLLGGVFCREFPLLKTVSELKHIWGWTQAEEPYTLRSIYEYFRESWRLLEGRSRDHPDLIVMGIGISRFDIPALFVRSLLQHTDTSENLFETYFKAKIVDLGDVGIPLFTRNQEPVLYPKTANALSARLRIQERKESGKTVWDMYDAGEFEAIKNRTANEVEVALKIASKITSRQF
jgi:hypothetical protein